ncbi:MAG: MDR family MFS transporter [Nitrospiraceae bacterium]|nr:MDR family MFS transporter [Nitrospiraceae bacterium]
MSDRNRQQPNAGPPGPREVRTVFAGLLLALSLASLDQNIVGVALPRIVSDLGGLEHLSWVVTSFLLTSTAVTPLYGKLSDLYGRKPLFLIAIVLFLIGSSLCGLSQTMAQLILFRGIQGLGAGGLMTLAMTTIADLVAPRERGRYQGLFGAVFAFSSIAGPLVGGFLTDVLSWRWIFYVNLPIGVMALLLIAFGFHRPHHALSHRIDYAGAVLLTLATTAILLVLTMGGTSIPWSSPVIPVLSALSVMFIVLLVMREQRAAEPVLSPHLFRNRVFIVASAVMALTFMGLFGAAVFLPLYFQLVLGEAPTRAGLLLVPMTLGVIFSSFVGGQIVSRTGKYKVLPVSGLAAAALAFLGVTAAAAAGAGLVLFEILLVTLGLGFGFVMPNLVVAIQNAVLPSEMGSATAASAFFRSLGGTFGVALSGAIMTAELRHLPGTAAGLDSRSLLQRGVQEIAGLPEAQRQAVIEAYRHAIGTTFLIGAVITALAFFAVLLLPEHPLRSSRHTSG